MAPHSLALFERHWNDVFESPADLRSSTHEGYTPRDCDTCLSTVGLGKSMSCLLVLSADAMGIDLD